MGGTTGAAPCGAAPVPVCGPAPVDESTGEPLLVQLAYRADAYRVLWACACIGRAPGRRAAPVVAELVERYPSAGALLAASRLDVEDLLRPLGLPAVRGGWLRRLCEDELAGVDPRVARGAGEYGRAAVAILCDGALDVETGDVALEQWRAWAVSS